MQDDFGAYAVFTEQGSFASQMTAAKIMDVQAGDAGYAYTGKIGRCSQIAQISQIRMSRCLDTSSTTQGGKIEDFVAFLERNLYGHPSAGLLWERQIEEALPELGWVKIPKWECMFRSSETRVIAVRICG